MTSVEEEEYRYLTVGELGKGGMGTVWEMHDTALNRRIAFKQMHPELVGYRSMEEYFINEARILARLEHPGIVPIHEYGVSTEDGTRYYTMEKVRGESLQSILDGLKNRNKAILRRWTLVRIIGAFSRLCETVAFAHEQGILHRDIKPDNVMLGKFGEVFLVDWGIAKEMGQPNHDPDLEEHLRISQTRLTSGGTSLFAMSENVFGTPGYMSPESANGNDTYNDGGSDIFALGAILYQILSLHPPYQADSPEEILTLAQAGEVPPLSEEPRLKPHLPGGRIPESISSIAMKALSPNRADRYETAQDMRRDIEAFLQGRTPISQNVGSWGMFRNFLRRNPGLVMVWTIAIATFVSILATGLNENYQNRLDAEQARDMALQKKRAFLAEKDASKTERSEAAPRFAQLAWDRLNIGDISRAESLANAALEFGGSDESVAKSHLVLGLVKVIRGYPDQAEEHWDLAETGPFLETLNQLRADNQPISWPDLLEQSELNALALLQLDSDPKAQLEKLKSLLAAEWDSKLWEISNTNLNRSGFFRLVLKNGIEPDELEYLRGWPIHHLVLTGIPIADLGRMADMPLLRILELGKGHLANDLSPLSELTKLTSLTVSPLEESPNFGFDLTPLGSLSRLESLKIDANVQSLNPIRRLNLNQLCVGQLVRNSKLFPLQNMPLNLLEVANPTNFSALSQLPLEVFRPGSRPTGYTNEEIYHLVNLPIKEIRLDGNVDENLVRLSKSKTLESIETDCLHPLNIWKNSALKSLHLKGNDHYLKGLEQTSITRLEITANSKSPFRSRPVLFPLLRASQLSELAIDLLPAEESLDYHIHLESPPMSKALLEGNWAAADKELRKLNRRYRKHPALVNIAQEWLPILKQHIAQAEQGISSHSWDAPIEHDGHVYQWCKTPASWQSAREMAEKLGGQLVTVDSEAEWAFLSEAFGIDPSSSSVWSGGDNRIWIGSAAPNVANSREAAENSNRRGEAPSIYFSKSKLVLEPTHSGSQWSYLIEWNTPAKPLFTDPSSTPVAP